MDAALGDGLILGLPHAHLAVVADTPTAIGVTQYPSRGDGWSVDPFGALWPGGAARGGHGRGRCSRRANVYLTAGASRSAAFTASNSCWAL